MPKPQISKDTEIMLKVCSIGLNPIDFKMRKGDTKLILPLKFPIMMGHECSGVVVEIGKDVSKFKIGDEVFLRKGRGNLAGTWAEYFVEEEKNVALKPKNLTLDEAASVPLAGLTAYQVIIEHGKLQKGQKVFIGAGAGGVGSFGIQFSKKICEAEVFTSASEKKKDICEKLGADHVIDYRNQKIQDVVKDVDLFFDTTGEVKSGLAITKPHGKLITIAGIPSSADLTDIMKSYKLSFYVPYLLDAITWSTRRNAHKKNIEYFYMWMKSDGEQLAQIGKWIEEGKIQPLIDKVFQGLDKIQEAVAHLESGHCTGKVVVHIADIEEKKQDGEKEEEKKGGR